MNSVNLLGRIASDVEIKATPGGVSVMTFRLAVDRPPSKDGERETDFITCVAWRSTAEFINKYFIKGSSIGISGKLRTRQYTDSRHAEVIHYATEVYVDSAFFTGAKSAQSSSQPYKSVDHPKPTEKRAESKPAAPVANKAIEDVGSLDDFEDILSDDGVPF